MTVPSFVSQDAPELPGFARYSVDLASAELPCGASWIANVLLELGVPIFNPWGADTRAEWQALGAVAFATSAPMPAGRVCCRVCGMAASSAFERIRCRAWAITGPANTRQCRRC